MNILLKLNLGCGEDRKPGYINVDKYGNPDILHDLEEFPWPWEDNSVEEVLLQHVLEHLGETTEAYFSIIKEIYRICASGSRIDIIVPHPRHNDFIDDPTHVRVITPAGLSLFSKSQNDDWIRSGCSNSPLGMYLDVDFEVISTAWVLDPVWELVLKDKDDMIISQAISRYNNVVKEIQIILKVVK
jgi:hypothetical protein